MHAITKNRIDTIQSRTTYGESNQNNAAGIYDTAPFMTMPVVPGQAVDQGNWNQQVNFLAPQRVGSRDNVPEIKTDVSILSTSKDKSLAGRLEAEARSLQQHQTDYQADSPALTFYQADLSDPNSPLAGIQNLKSITGYSKSKNHINTRYADDKINAKPLYSYIPLSYVIKNRIRFNNADDFTNNINWPVLLFSIIAFILSYRANNKCKPTIRIFKALVAALFGLLYIFIYIIKFSLENCNP